MAMIVSDATTYGSWEQAGRRDGAATWTEILRTVGCCTQQLVRGRDVAWDTVAVLPARICSVLSCHAVPSCKRGKDLAESYRWLC